MSISVRCINDGDTRDYARDIGRHCGTLLPTGNPRDLVDGIWVTCIDGGVPLALLCASTLSGRGLEAWPSHARQTVCEQDAVARLNRIRLQTGYLMNLGDVSARTVPGVVVVNQGSGEAHCCAYRLSPEGQAYPLSQAEGASLAMAFITSDTIAHELHFAHTSHKTLSGGSPELLVIDTLGAFLRYQSSI